MGFRGGVIKLFKNEIVLMVAQPCMLKTIKLALQMAELYDMRIISQRSCYKNSMTINLKRQQGDLLVNCKLAILAKKN